MFTCFKVCGTVIFFSLEAALLGAEHFYNVFQRTLQSI
jgi:hypothetical protein